MDRKEVKVESTRAKVIKLIAVCVICLGLISGMVILIQALTG
jgi:hypothetical protein